MLKASWKKNDKKAKWLIYSFSAIMFLMVTALGRIHIQSNLGFDVHIFAMINAIINTTVAVLLVGALFAVKAKHYLLHKKLMMSALVLSVFFLISYVIHHLFAGSTVFGGEGIIKYFYYILLITHIPLAGIVLPFILFTAYRALVGDYDRHKKMAKYTWPIWFYVAISGPILYILIKPYY